CLVYSWGVWHITQEEWDKHVAPFWEMYEPTRLHIKRKWGMGTEENPYRIWHLKLYYQHTGKARLLWDGAPLEWEALSQPNALDIEKAPEGGLLFGVPEEGFSGLRGDQLDLFPELLPPKEDSLQG